MRPQRRPVRRDAGAPVTLGGIAIRGPACPEHIDARPEGPRQAPELGVEGQEGEAIKAEDQPPGRDFDEMIHRGVLGWTFDLETAIGGPTGSQIGPAFWVRGSETLPYNDVPAYSTDDRAAVQMLHEAFPDGHTVTPDGRGNTTVTIGAHTGTASSLALAACRAALKAKKKA